MLLGTYLPYLPTCLDSLPTFRPNRKLIEHRLRIAYLHDVIDDFDTRQLELGHDGAGIASIASIAASAAGAESSHGAHSTQIAHSV